MLITDLKYLEIAEENYINGSISPSVAATASAAAIAVGIEEPDTAVFAHTSCSSVAISGGDSDPFAYTYADAIANAGGFNLN